MSLDEWHRTLRTPPITIDCYHRTASRQIKAPLISLPPSTQDCFALKDVDGRSRLKQVKVCEPWSKLRVCLWAYCHTHPSQLPTTSSTYPNQSHAIAKPAVVHASSSSIATYDTFNDSSKATAVIISQVRAEPAAAPQRQCSLWSRTIVLVPLVRCTSGV